MAQLWCRRQSRKPCLLLRTVRGADHALDRSGALLADQTADLLDDLALSGLAAEHEACDRDCQDEKRRHRKGRVVGKCRCHARGRVIAPSAEGLLNQPKNHRSFRVRLRPVMDFDLIGGPAGSGKPYAMFERCALRRYETIAKEADNRVNDIQVRILERAFKTDPCCYSVLALVPPQLRDSFGSPSLHFSDKAAVLGRFQFQVIENRL